MKYYLDGIIIVEGTNDSSYLSSFIDALYIETNGYELPKEEIDFINYYSKNRKVIILTDSDLAGELIREKLKSLIQNPVDIKVNVLKCNRNGKHGVAECEKEEVLNVLKEHFVEKTHKEGTVTLSDFYNCGIVNKETREHLCKALHLGRCNNKTALKRINYLNLTKQNILKAMEGHHGN